MNLTRKDGVTTCHLTKAEFATIERAVPIVEQLAYHFRPVPYGETLESVWAELCRLAGHQDITVADPEDFDAAPFDPSTKGD